MHVFPCAAEGGEQWGIMSSVCHKAKMTPTLLNQNRIIIQNTLHFLISFSVAMPLQLELIVHFPLTPAHSLCHALILFLSCSSHTFYQVIIKYFPFRVRMSHVDTNNQTKATCDGSMDWVHLFHTAQTVYVWIIKESQNINTHFGEIIYLIIDLNTNKKISMFYQDASNCDELPL